LGYEKGFGTVNSLSGENNSQTEEIYGQFLRLPNTGMVQILPDSVYRRQANIVQNRPQANFNGYPLPL
jgi:hypothetical protein